MSIDIVDFFKFKQTALTSEADLDTLFMEFSKYYVKKPIDLLTLSGSFYSTMLSMKESLNYSCEEQRGIFERRLRPFSASRQRLLTPKNDRINIQAPYVNIVSKLIPHTDKVLDVGGGVLPYSSLLMKDYFKRVGAMDRFVVAEEALSTTGIQAINSYFRDTTPIIGYDYVVGSMPCTAIRSIVANCHENNKGYIIKLCNCDLEHIAEENDGIYRGWEEILSEIDPSVKFNDGHEYAFNVDATKNQFRKIESDARTKDATSLKNSVLGELRDYAQAHPLLTKLEPVADDLQ